MDPAAVSRSILSALLQVLFDRIAPWEFTKELDTVQFEKMKTKFWPANLVLNDAEQKRFSDPRVKKWLDDLQAVIYDTQYLMDQIDLYVAQNKMGKIKLRLKGRSASQFNEEIREILVKLENIVDLKDHLLLKHGVQNIRLVTTSLVEESSVYGRDADGKAIIKLLLSHEMSCNKMSVIPIVGISGIRKTTLAQLIYNDSEMEHHFDFKVWVCVTDDFDIFEVTKTIAKEVITSQRFDNDDLKREFTSSTFDSGDLDFLQVKLKKALKGRKLLLVLDDIWIEDYSPWTELKKPFDHGECESKVIVTAQNQKVASVMMCNLPSYHLKTMLEDDCWKLFEKTCLQQFKYSKCPSKARKIGKEIVRKCKGFPLGIKSLGCLLRNQPNSKEWESILDSGIWFSKMQGDDIHRLLMCYHDLPSHLKWCFAYCSIFPKNHQIDKEDLIKLWMAEDLLQPQDMKRIEEVGEEYLDNLLSRSLFQRSISRNKSFTMDDHVNGLASFIVGGFCLRSDCSSLIEYSSSKIRNWSHIEGRNNNWEKLEGSVEAKHLRSLLLATNDYFNIKLLFNKFVKLLPSLTCLKVLSLHGSSIKELPDSVGDLKLLKYLNLSKTRIRKMPNAVCTLYNLQMVLLQLCLELESLPDDMNKLTNLRHLDIKHTCIEKMPTKMGSLKDLQTLSVFVLGKDNAGSTIKELQNLQDLGGSLHILGLEHVVNVEDVLAGKLKDMKYLTELEFSWGFKSGCPKNMKRYFLGCNLTQISSFSGSSIGEVKTFQIGLEIIGSVI